MIKPVKVPKEFEAALNKAEKYVKKFFSKQGLDLSKGIINISDNRYLLIRSASLSIDFFECVRALYSETEKKEAIYITEQLLFDVGHTIGMRDAKHFHKQMNIVDPLEKILSGPLYFVHSGWAFVDIHPDSNFSFDENFFSSFEVFSSFEAEAWLKAGKKTDKPICNMIAGYSSGSCEQSIGVSLVSTEITCRAKGDKSCLFIMAHPSKIENKIQDYLKQNPEIAKRATHYEIPGFFKLKIAEAALRNTNEQLNAINQELLDKSKSLKKKLEMTETLSKFEGILPTCTTNEEIYALFLQYGKKLFPVYEGRLWIFEKGTKELQNVVSWGQESNANKNILSSSDRKAIRHDKSSLHPSFAPELWHDPIPQMKDGNLYLPLTAGSENFGSISIACGKSLPSQEEKLLISRLAGDIALAFFNVKVHDSLRELAIHDFLTGLYNRRHLEDLLSKEMMRARRNKESLGIIMFDIDHFKKFNDTFGHDAGDTILISLGKFLKKEFRGTDIACRFGGEEFMIIMIGANEESTMKKAEFLQKRIKALHPKSGDQLLNKINISLGVAVYPTHGRTLRSLLEAADKALYRAKNEGRDKICLATSS